MTPAQKAAVAAILNTDLSTLDSDRLIELCVIYRAAPEALDTFPAALKAELERRYSSEVIASEDVNFGVLQHMSNQFQSAIPYFHLKLLEMAATVNRDIWFTDNEALFRVSIDNAEVAAWIVKQPDILNKCLGNRLALGYIAQSVTAATAILSDETACAMWKNAPDLWQVWPLYRPGFDVVAKSAELTQYIIDTAPALAAVIAATIAMQALAASPTAMRIMADTGKAMTAVAASSVAMQAVAASSVAMQAVAAEEKFKAELIQHNEQLQAVRAIMYDTVKAHWTQARNIQLRDGQSGERYENNNSALATPANALVFVCLGSFSGWNAGRHRLEHPDGSTAANGGYRNAPTTMLAVDAVSFVGAKVKQTVQFGHSYAEVWAPKQ
nr:MAG TPA: Tail fiber protein [Caudoviricetes sp.]